jgi:hypothetical protein
MRISLFSVLFASILVSAVGCQSTTKPAPSTAAASPQRAVIVSAGNAGPVTVFLPSDDPSKPTALCASGQETVCPECQAAAAKYFQTGVLDPKCSKTGAMRTAVIGVPPTYGHN